MSRSQERERVSVSLVVPNYNGASLLPALFESIRAQSYAPDAVIIVDDASTDNSPQLAAELGAVVLQRAVNRGFAACVNSGVRYATTKWVAVVNSDVVLDREWLGTLVDTAERSQAAYACGPVRNARQPELLDGSYDLLARSACPWRAGAGMTMDELREPPRTWLASLTAVLLRRDIFEDLGGLDERFNSYLEDVDYGLLCRRHGLMGEFVPTATATHLGSASFGRWSARSTRLQSRNQVWLIAKHYPRNWRSRVGFSVLVGQLLWGLLALRHGAFASWLRGKLDGIAGWRKMRRRAPIDMDYAAAFYADLDNWEYAIAELQGRPARDAYWRAYFRFTQRRNG